MKKIFYLFILSTILFTGRLTFFATESSDLGEVTKPLICVEGNDYSESLSYPGFNIVYNNVNFNLPGRYMIIYEDQNKEQYQKVVDVISKKSIEGLPYYQIEKTVPLLNDYYAEGVLCTLEVDQYFYLVYVFNNRDTEERIVYLNIYNNGSLINNIEISREVRIDIVKLVPYQDNIIMVGSIYDEQYDYDLYYRIINKNGEMLDECRIIGDKKEEIIDGVVVNDYIYIFGRTKSTSGYYNGTIDTDVFYFKIDLNVGIVRKAYVSKVTSVEYLSNIVLVGEYFYLGYSKMSDGVLHHYVQKIDLNFNIVEELLLGMLIDFQFCKFVTYNNQIYLLNENFSDSYDKYIGTLYVFNSDLRLVYKRAYIFEGYYLVYGRDLVINDRGVVSILFEVVDENNKRGYSVIKEFERKEILNILQMDNHNVFSFLDSSGNSFFVQNGLKLNKVQINSIIVDDFGSEEIDSNTSIHNYQVMVNSEYLEIDEKYSNLEYNLNSFGTYRIIYGFNSDDVLFFYHLDVYVKEKVNLIGKEEYDLNYVLTFNGIGYLNGEKISTNYQIKDEGQYTLEIVGNNNERKYYEFMIKDNSCIVKYLNDDIKLEKIDFNSPFLSNLSSIDIYQDSNQRVGNKNQNNWMLLIPGIILITSVIVIIKIH